MSNEATQGETKFEYENIWKIRNELDGKYSEFAKILKDSVELIKGEMNEGDDSAFNCAASQKFVNLWDDNISTFADFYENFNAWSQAMTVASTNFSDYEELIKMNRTTGASMDGIKELVAEKSAASTISNEQDATLKSYQENYEEPGGITLAKGDSLKVDDRDVKFYSKVNGEYYFEDANGFLFKLGDSGNLVACMQDEYYQYNTNTSGLSFMETVSNNYENGVYEKVGLDADTMSRMGISSEGDVENGVGEYTGIGVSDFSPSDLSQVVQFNNSFKTALENRTPVIEIDNRISMPWWTTDLNKDNATVKFVYDDRTGNYYISNSDGSYDMSRGWTPEEMAKWDIEEFDK